MNGLKELSKEICNDSRIPKEYKQFLFNKLINSPIFIIENFECNDGKKYLDSSDTVEFALPFGSCYFEGVGNYLLGIQQGKIEIAAIGLLVIEMAPNEYTCSYVVKDLNTGKKSFSQSVISMDLEAAVSRDSIMTQAIHMGMNVDAFIDRQKKMSALISDSLSKILNKIHNSHYGKEITHRSISLKGLEGNINYKPSTIIRIKSKSEENENIKPIMRGKIEWMKCWWTRGHWRKHEGIGKNRSGDYVISGNTWVKEHIKGDDTIEPKKKVYIV